MCLMGVQEQFRKRVGFTGSVHVTTATTTTTTAAATDDISDTARPNRLHRRDTPHHLKNKRINITIDRDKVASIIAQVSYLFLILFQIRQSKLLLFENVHVLTVLLMRPALRFIKLR